MDTRSRNVARCVWVLLLACLFCGAFGQSAFAQQGNATVRVMTRNMDAGTDLNYLLAAQGPGEFVTGLVKTVAEVDASQIAARSQLLAAEIAAAKPDLVALQEVTFWHFLDASGDRTYDQLALLEDALQAAGAHYRVLAVQTLTDIPVSIPGLLEARFTDHNAILVRTDVPAGHLQVLSFDSGLFQAMLPFTFPDDTTVPVPQGWMSADVRIRGARFKFVNTHLTSATLAVPITVEVQQAQGFQLLQVLGETSLPVILAGDFNSDMSGSTTALDKTPTGSMIAGAGYTDVWNDLRGADLGFTWPLFLEDQLADSGAPPALFSERIDLIFARGPIATAVDRTGLISTAGLFASDHAGVVADFALDNHRPEVPGAKGKK